MMIVTDKHMLLAVCICRQSTFGGSREYHLTACMLDKKEGDSVTMQDVYEYAADDKIVSYSPMFNN